MLMQHRTIFISLRYLPKLKVVRKESGSGANQFFSKTKGKTEETNSLSSWTVKVSAQRIKTQSMTPLFSVFLYSYQQWQCIIHNKVLKRNQLKVLLWHPNCVTELSISRVTQVKKRKIIRKSKTHFKSKTTSKSLVLYGYLETSCWD